MKPDRFPSWADVKAILKGQAFLFPRFNHVLLRIYGRVTVVGDKRRIYFGRGVRMFEGVCLDVAGAGNLSRLHLSEGVTLENGAYLKAHGGSVVLGKRVFVGMRSIIQGKGRVNIGDWTMLGPNVQIYSSDHIFSQGEGPYRDRGEIASEVVIGRNVWIGANCIVCKGAKIGEDAVIAAGAVIKGDIKSGWLYAGEGLIAKAIRPVSRI